MDSSVKAETLALAQPLACACQTILCHAHNNFVIFSWATSLVPRPHPLQGKGSGDSWAFSWFLQAQHFCLAQANQIAALRFSCDIASCCEATLYRVSCLGLAVANQNAALRFWIPLCSNVQTARDQLHNIAAKSRACTTKKPFQCHQTFSRAGIRGWERDYWATWGHRSYVNSIHLMEHLYHKVTSFVLLSLL